jgi:predicted aspartyl protease
MKNVTMLIILLFATNLAFAQDVAECEKIVLQTYGAINKQNADPIMQYLSEDFSVAGQTGEIAKMVIPQLFNQLNVEISNIKKISETRTDVLTLVYEANFGEMGTKTSTFVFNKKNQLKALELLKMQVKSMKKGANIIKNEQAYFKVPFKRVGNLISVEAKLNGVLRTFLVDNGAPVFVLNNAHVEKDTFHQKITVNEAEGVGGKISGMDFHKIESFELEGIKMDSQQVVSVDLAHLEEETKTTFYGLIGFEIYKDYDLLFDYEKNTITFLKPDATEDFLKNNFKSQKRQDVPLEMKGHIAVVDGFINGKKYALGIDCGAESSLFDVALTSELKSNLIDLKRDTLTGADKNALEVLSGRLKSLKIGATKFKKTKASFSDMSHLNKGYNIKLDGLIGYDLLSNQPTLISYKNKKVIFLK